MNCVLVWKVGSDMKKIHLLATLVSFVVVMALMMLWPGEIAPFLHSWTILSCKKTPKDCSETLNPFDLWPFLQGSAIRGNLVSCSVLRQLISISSDQTSSHPLSTTRPVSCSPASLWRRRARCFGRERDGLKTDVCVLSPRGMSCFYLLWRRE